jgi:hypothetical protein
LFENFLLTLERALCVLVSFLLAFRVSGRRRFLALSRCVALFRPFSDLLENGILDELLVDHLRELHTIQLKQLDRLLKLRRHHEGLAKSQALFEFKRHN